MSILATMVSCAVLAQAQPDAQVQAAQAAQKSAEAAERAARAAERAADAVEALVRKEEAKPAPAPAAAAPSAGTPWKSTAGLSLIWLAGNSNTLTFNGTGTADKKWGVWGLGLKGYATYGQTTTLPSGAPSQVTAMAAGAKVRGDRSVDEVTLFVAVGGDTNHVKSVEFVGYGEAGAGLTWLSRKEADFEKVYLRTDLSVHYEHETDFQYYPTVQALPWRQLLGPRISGVFRYALKKDILFSQDVEVIPNVLGDSRVRLNANTKLASRLTEALSMNVSFQLQYDSVPPPTKVPTDTALTLGVEVAL
ncbi:MAG TPA: DUF481 domain-containing protein [Myxococcaceae bacterium]|nr:DUF481 domain-containing protein [Myxococcaceae bacterium]